MPPRIRHLLRCARVASIGLTACLAAAAPAHAAGPKRAAPTASPSVSTETLPALLQRGAQAFAAGDFPQAADAFGQVESVFGRETAWASGTLPRRLLPLRGFAALRAGRASDAAADLATFVERFPEETAQRGFALYALALALQQAGDSDAALSRFLEYEAMHPGSAQAALARLQRAEICFASARPDEGFRVLDELRLDATLAESLRGQARLRALEQAVALRRDDLAAGLLLHEPWGVTTMPELGILAFAAMETGDRLLAAGRAYEAVRAYQLVAPKPRLVAAQRERLEAMRRSFDQRAPAVSMGSGLFWVDYYRGRIHRIETQLLALERAEDYSGALRLRLGQAMLLAGRAHEAWLCFESVALAPGAHDELRREGHYRWILSAAELARWDEALAIAGAFVERHPASDLAPEAFFLIARAHLEQKDYAAAEPVLSQILERFPAHPAALRSRFTRGWVRTVREAYAAARADFEACIATAPDAPLAVRAGLWRGMTHHFARERAEALAVFDALAAAHPHDPLLPEILYRRATTLYAMRDLARARTGLEHFVAEYRMHPRFAEALVLLGDILMGAGELDQARARFSQVTPEAADSYVYATFQIGKVLRAEGRHAALADHFRDFVRHASHARLPRVSEALHQIGWAEEQCGRAEAALPVYAEALARFGDDPAAGEVGAALTALHKLARRLGRTEAAALVSDDSMRPILAGDFEGWLRTARQEALKQRRHTWHARLTLALADLHLARREPAQAELLVLELAALPIEALDAVALARTGEALQAIGSEEAARYFHRLLAAHPQHPARAVALHGLAAEAAAAGRYEDALHWVARFDDETPAHALAIRTALLAGEMLEETGRHAEAATRYDALLRLKSARGRPHALALAGLARCAQADGEIPRAIACYQRVYTLHRAQSDLAAEAYLGSGPLFEQLGDAVAAAATYREMLALPDVGDSTQRERARDALGALASLAPTASANSPEGAP